MIIMKLESKLFVIGTILIMLTACSKQTENTKIPSIDLAKTGGRGSYSSIPKKEYSVTKECFVSGCHEERTPPAYYCKNHNCSMKNCKSKKIKKSDYCRIHSNKYSDLYDTYDVYDYADPDDFAEEMWELFEEDYDDGYDEAYDYWEERHGR